MFIITAYYKNLARLCNKLTIEYYQKALKICIKLLGKNHPHTKIVQQNLNSVKQAGRN